MDKLGITPLPVRFELHAYGETYDVSNSLSDWKEIEAVLSRKDTSGVYMEVSFPFKFVLESYDIVAAIFEDYGFQAKADMYIYLRNNDWTYSEPSIFNLDFSTYERSYTVIEISSRRSDLYEHLREKESVNFDIPVSGIKEDFQWNNTRIIINNSLTEGIYSDLLDDIIGTEGVKTIGISYEKSEILVPDIIEEKTIGGNLDMSDDNYFLIAKKSTSLNLELKLTAVVELGNLAATEHPYGVVSFTFAISKSPVGGELIILTGGTGSYKGNGNTEALTFNVDFSGKKSKVLLSEGEKLYLVAIAHFVNTAGYNYIRTTSPIEGKLIIEYEEANIPVLLNVISPSVLLQKLADKITGTEGYAGNPPYQASIEGFNENDQDLTMLAAAESIRGFDKAKVHTSYKDFKAWMATQGYEPFINKNRLTFRKREKSFNKNLTAIELTEEDCADLKINVDNDYLFSGLKIGYKKKEYENINGRFEFNGQHDYATDYTGNAKVLELISPYRADSYGIEFLCMERGKDTTDDKSDKDLFIVNVKKSGNGNYGTAYAATLSGNVPNSTLFNTKYNPFELLKLNAGLLGASVNTLKFTASDANKDIIIDEKRIDGDYDIPEEIKLFSAINYDFASRNIKDLPDGDNVNGVVKIHYRGKAYEGFIKEISKNPAWEAETQWVLFKKHGIT